MKHFITPFRKNVVYAVFFFLLSLSLIYAVMDRLGYVHTIPNENNLLNYDAKWYHSIATEGYKYVRGMCNIAFFPLFPMLWKILDVDAITIALSNFAIFITAFIWLFRATNFSIWSLLFVLSFPSSIFFALPYSEALFFLSGAMILTGLRTQSIALQFAGFLFASITRSVSVVFVPAIVILFIFSKKKEWGKALLNIVACVLGTLIAAIIQYLNSGRWFYFLEVQQYWGRRWKFPTLPLTTHNPENILGTDVFALTIGLISFFILIKYIYEWFNNTTAPKERKLEERNQSLLFCMLYVCAVAVLDSFFTNEIAGKTNIWSINRHILATPFGAYFILTCLNKTYPPAEKLIMGILYGLALITTQLYRYPIQLVFYVILCSFFFLTDSNKELAAYRVLILILLVFHLVYIFQVFLSHNWVG